MNIISRETNLIHLANFEHTILLWDKLLSNGLLITFYATENIQKIFHDNNELGVSRVKNVLPLSDSFGFLVSSSKWKSLLTHHSWWWKCLDIVILGPSISQEVYWNSLSCSRLHRFVASTQSQTLSPDCYSQQGCYELQGLYEQDYFHRDDSNKKKA